MAALLDFRRAEEVNQLSVYRQTVFPSENPWREAMCKGGDNICEQNRKNICSKGVCILVGEDRISKISRKMITEG